MIRSYAVSPRRNHGLPLLPTPLIGREVEIAEARRLITAGGERLLTLTGPPGVGKTSLALTVAHELADEFRYGARLVDLSPLEDAARVPVAIADGLGMRRSGERPPLEQVIRFVRDRRLLLVLDNFEQVVAAAPMVAELLAGCPNVTVLATSRVPLRLRWETELAVGPLALPAAAHLEDVATLANVASVALFIGRAQVVSPALTLTHQNAGLVRDLCVALDGLPLAIELAAARARTVPLIAMHASLTASGVPGRAESGVSVSARFGPLELLADGARDLPARQRTLRDAIAWSYDLLNPTEQTLLRRLAVFVGGCTFEAATTVCEASWETIAVLIEQNLVRNEQSAPRAASGQIGEPRLRLLETVREFGIEQLVARGEWLSMHQRHAAFYLDLAEQAAPELTGSRQLDWLDRLAEDQDNLNAATEWASEQDDPEILLRLGAALWRFWWSSGDGETTRRRVGSILALGGRSEPTHARARALSGVGVLALMLGDYQAAKAMFEEGRRVAEALGDHHAMAVALYDLGRLNSYQGEYEEADALLHRSLDLLRRLDSPSALASTLTSLGLLAYQQCEFATARDRLQQALQAAVAVGDRRAVAQAYHVFGLTYHGEGRIDAARQQYQQCLPIFQALGDRHSIAMTLSDLGSLAAMSGDRESARAYYRAGLIAAREAGNKRRQAFTVSSVAALLASRAPAEAIRLDTAAVEACKRLGARPERAMRALYEASLAPAWRMLGEDGAAAAEIAGRGMTLDDAVDETIAWLAEDGRQMEAEPDGSAGGASSAADAVALTARSEQAAPSLAGLTRRERDVATLLARGQTTNREIAAALVITEGTAANYVQRVLNRLELRTRAQVAAWAAEHHLHEGQPGT
jgi:predicted ATPase/DNA-binding CsgD family transcriptional regulator